jgi:hypothetical protein
MNRAFSFTGESCMELSPSFLRMSFIVLLALSEPAVHAVNQGEGGKENKR